MTAADVALREAAKAEQARFYQPYREHRHEAAQDTFAMIQRRQRDLIHAADRQRDPHLHIVRESA